MRSTKFPFANSPALHGSGLMHTQSRTPLLIAVSLEDRF